MSWADSGTNGWGDEEGGWDMAESFSDFSDDGWGGEEGMLGAAYEFGHGIRGTGDDFFDGDADAAGSDEFPAERDDDPGGDFADPNDEWLDVEDATEWRQEAVEMPVYWEEGYRLADEADADLNALGDANGGSAGDWSMEERLDGLPNEGDPFNQGHSDYSDEFLAEQADEAEDGGGDSFDRIGDAMSRFRADNPEWGQPPDDVLDDPEWERSGEDQGVYFDLKYPGDEDAGYHDSSYDVEGAYGDTTPEEDLIAMKEELLDLELEHAQQADQTESDTLQHPEDTEADRQDDEDEHRHDTGPGTK